MSADWFERLMDSVEELSHAAWAHGADMGVVAGAGRLAAFQKVLRIAQEMRRPYGS